MSTSTNHEMVVYLEQLDTHVSAENTTMIVHTGQLSTGIRKVSQQYY